MKTLITQIINLTAGEYNVSPESITGWDRTRLPVLARETAVHIAANHTQLNTYELAKFFGERHHSTIWNATKRAQDDLETNKAFRTTYNLIDQKVKELL